MKGSAWWIDLMLSLVSKVDGCRGQENVYNKVPFRFMYSVAVNSNQSTLFVIHRDFQGSERFTNI